MMNPRVMLSPRVMISSIECDDDFESESNQDQSRE